MISFNNKLEELEDNLTNLNVKQVQEVKQHISQITINPTDLKEENDTLKAKVASLK